MANNVNISVRVDPAVKEQAEAVLDRLGISMATAMEIYLRQIAMRRRIPFDLALPYNGPIPYHSLSEAEFDALISQAMQSYSQGGCTPIGDFMKELSAEGRI